MAGSSALGLALGENNTLFGFGTNERATLGYPSKDEYVGPHEMEIELVDGSHLRENETIVDVGVLKQVMYVLTSERLLYAGKCVGQCGSYNNRPVFTDDEEADLGKFKEFQLPFDFSKLRRVRLFETAILLVTTEGKLYISGLNNFAQLCQDPSLNIRSWAVEPNKLGLSDVQFVGVGTTNSVFVKNNRMYVCGKNQVGDFRLVNVSQDYLVEPT